MGILLFDALAHPTLTGNWLGQDTVSSFEALDGELDAADYIGACAIGLAGIGGYGHTAFIKRCKAFGRLIPIAGFDPGLDSNESALADLRAMGFVGIKIHPRFSKLTHSIDQLVPVLRAAEKVGLVVFYCTYMHCAIDAYPDTDPFYSLVRLLRASPHTRVVLVHGGDVELLRYAELVRFNPNLLLDLSLTLMKYSDSSVDQDLAFLFRKFDRRICIGSDWPEYSLRAVRERFEAIGNGVASDKVENVAARNILGFLGISV